MLNIRKTPRRSTLKFSVLLSALLVPLFSGCGGESSSSGVVIEGTLIQGAVSSHHRTDIRLKHSQHQPIEEVLICGLGQCSQTDLEGVWGFLLSDGFSGGPIELDIDGHGILTSTIVELPPGASHYQIELVHSDNNVTSANIWADGIRTFAAEEHHHGHTH